MLTFCNAIEPPLTLRGPRGLLAVSHQMYRWLSGIWGTASLRKNTSHHDLFVSNPNVSLCSGFNHQRYCCCFSLISWHYLIMLLSTVALSAYFFHNACSVFSKYSVKVHLIIRHILLEFQWLFTWVSVIFHLMFNGFSFNSFIIFELSNAIYFSCVIVELY